jgi:hypothetical protein
MLSLVSALLLSAIDAAAQGGPTNTNTLSTGSNQNTNTSSNTQFLSGSNTGVNNGLLEIYAGSEPYQGIILEGSTNLPQLPGIPAPPSNFSQPYRPDAFVNGPPFLPAEITLAEAKKCRDAKSSWYGGSRDDDASSMKFFYAGKTSSPPLPLTMANYVGTAMATTADGPFLAALCEAAYQAMRKGATVGMVEFNIRPKNTMAGIGFGTSGGATGLPVAGANPYALAGTLGFGTGWSNQRVEGEVVLQLTALHESGTASPASPSAAPPVSAVPPARDDDAPATEPPPRISSNGFFGSAAPQILLAAASPSSEISAPRTADRRPEPPLDDREPSPSEPPREGASIADATSIPENLPAASVPRVSSDRRASSSIAASERSQPPAYHSTKRLARVRKGQRKEVVFELFETAFRKQGGRLVEVRGMRLRASSRSATHALVEVSEVSLAEGRGHETPYWFLFERGRLLAWGRPEQWDAAVNEYNLRLPYRPALPPSPAEAKVDPGSGR